MLRPQSMFGQLYGKKAAALYTQAGDYQKTARFCPPEFTQQSFTKAHRLVYGFVNEFCPPSFTQQLAHPPARLVFEAHRLLYLRLIDSCTARRLRPCTPRRVTTRRPPGFARPHHPGGNPGANLKSISHRCLPILVAFVWELP